MTFRNVTTQMMSSNQLFPAGHYKNVYNISNNDGVVFKIITIVLNFSMDKGEI